MNISKLISQLAGILPLRDEKSSVKYEDKKTFDYGPFKPLPNVRLFRVKLSEWDELFDRFSINKRYPASFTVEPYKNDRLNRYLRHQLLRMRKSNSLTAWRIGNHMIKKSNIFFTMALNHVFPKWPREMKLSSVIRLALATRRIANSKESMIDLNRVYIPKANGKMRPLGVPTPAWRIYLHMLNQILAEYLNSRDLFHDAQHGFRPGRGTMTAWKVVMEKVIKARDIFEFDLHDFFNQVNLDYISVVLIKKGIPIDMVKRFYYLNCSYIKVKPPYLLNEFEQQMKKLMEKFDSESVIHAPRPISYMYRTKGVPQGSPTSPILSTLCLENSILDRGVDTVMYADDGLYYGNIDQPLITPNSNMVTSNIRFSLSKSGWVKKDNVWLKPLKFLGLTYYPNEFKAQTRKGSTLVYDKDKLVKLYEERANESANFNPKEWETWEGLVKSKIFGFIQSRMYQGSWNLDDIKQNFELTGKENAFINHRVAKSRMTIYNYSTYSSEWLCKKLKNLKIRPL